MTRKIVSLIHGQWLLAGFIVAAFSSIGLAHEILRPGLKEVAVRIAELAHQRGSDAIQVQSPDGPTAAGTGMRRILEDELKKSFGIGKVPARHPLRVTGSFYEDDGALMVEWQLKDGGNRPIVLDSVLPATGVVSAGTEATDSVLVGGTRPGVFQLGFRGPAAVPLAMGRSEGLLGRRVIGSEALEEQRSQQHNEIFVGLNRSSTGVGAVGCYLSVIVNGQARRIESPEYGVSNVSLKRGDEFTLRMNNPFSFPIGVEIAIDGVNSFSLSRQKSRGGKTFKRYVIPAKTSQMEIPGWYITSQQAKAFHVVDFNQSVVAQLQQVQAARLGTISAYVYRLKQPGDRSTIERVAETRTVYVPRTMVNANGEEYTEVVTELMTVESLVLNSHPLPGNGSSTGLANNGGAGNAGFDPETGRPIAIGAGRRRLTDSQESAVRWEKAEEIAAITIRYDKLGQARLTE